MRHSDKFHPEWGYLAPVPSFIRIARVVLAATAVGAIAGAGVVLSLAGHPSSEVMSSAVQDQSGLAAIGPVDLAVDIAFPR